MLRAVGEADEEVMVYETTFEIVGRPEVSPGGVWWALGTR